MPTQITLLGLTPLAQAFGLALAARGFPVTGFDPDLEVARAAQKRGAAQTTHWNMARAAEKADLTLIDLPLAQQREVFAALATTFPPGSAIATLSPLLAPPLAWAAETLPADRRFLATHPLLSPAQPEAAEPEANWLRQAVWAVAPASTATPEALQLLQGLANVAGATLYFVDPVEHDGLMGGASALPGLLAIALMRAATASPGWPEMRKVADRGFATATAALAAPEIAALFQFNREPTLRYLDAALAELQTLRAALANNALANNAPANNAPAELNAALKDAADRRAQWLAELARGDWDTEAPSKTEMPTSAGMLKRLLVGGLFDRPSKKRQR